MYHTMAGPFVFGQADDPAIAIRSVALDYTPGELRRRKIRRIRIRDVLVNARAGAEGISFPGFAPRVLAGNGKAGTPLAGGASGLAALTPEKIQIRSCMIHYKWARLGLQSDGEDVILRLQFDGKPANPLPFVYNKSLGRFVRVQANVEGSPLQGISPDMNLGLPLNRLLQYKGIVKIIE